MIGLDMPHIDRWSSRVVVVLGQNPGPFTGPGTNTFIVGTGRARLLLDTGQGISTYLDLLAQALSEHADDATFQEIVLTHAHPDHIGGVESVRERFGHLEVRKMPRPEMDLGIEVIDTRHDDVIRTEGATLRAIHTPGHASDHLCFYLEEEKAVFTGDVVLGAGTTVIPRDGDLGDYLDSLNRLLELEMEALYPAHGPAIREPHARIREYLDHRALRDRQIVDGIEAGVADVESLVRRIYVDVPSYLYPAAGVSVEAHLRKLQKEGVVARDGDRWVPAA
jgi:glyoxylase-like metal-dependent hydrolase (beta-lactamase superfamily II)